MAEVGHGVWIKLDFADGGKCTYERPFLVVNKTGDKLHLINVSSLKNKERKLGMNSNKRIVRFRPPFITESFVKLDSVYIVPDNEFIDSKILCNKRKIHPAELKGIREKFNEYRLNNKVKIKEYILKEIEEMNSELSAV